MFKVEQPETLNFKIISTMKYNHFSIFLFVVILITTSCNSTKKEIDVYFDEISAPEFKINDADLEVFIPYVEIIGLENPKGVEDNVMNHFFEVFKTYYKMEEFYLIPEFRNNSINGNQIFDSIKKSEILPEILVKNINNNKKYSLFSKYDAYHGKNRVNLTVCIFENKTQKKVYSHYSVRPINFDHSKGLNEYKKEVFTRFLKQ